MDGSVGQEDKGAGFILEIPNGVEFAYALKYYFVVSNNESEYEALIVGLWIALAMNIDQLIIRGDSKVVFDHVTGSFKAKEEDMKKYYTLVKSLLV